MKLSSIIEFFKQSDKQKHIIAGFVISIIFGFLSTSWFVGFLFASFVGVIKELWDLSGHGTPDWMDLIATMIGGLVGGIIPMIIYGIV